MKMNPKGPASSSAGSSAAVADPPSQLPAPKRDRELISIDLSAIEAHPDNPRGKITEADVADLAESIRQLGLLSPIGVVRVRDGFQCLYGHRRRIAAQVAGLTRVDVIVFAEDTPADVAEAIMLADNAQHVAPDPIAEANVVAQLAHGGKSEAEISRLIGKSPTWVATRLALSKLPAKILAETLRARDREPWPIAALEELAREPDQKRQREIVGRYQYGRPTAQAIRHEVMLDKRRIDLAPWKPDDATLCPKAGACSSCPKTSAKSGSLFFDEELDEKKGRSALCLDGICWNVKMAAHLKAEIAKEEARVGKQLPVAIDSGCGVEVETLGGRRAYHSGEFSTKRSALYSKPVDVVTIGKSGVRTSKVFVLDSSGTSASMPRGQKSKKKISDMKPAEARAAREERAMQRARSASLDTLIALAREVAEPDQSQAIAAAFLFGGRTHGCDEGAYHRPHDKDAKARPAVLKAMSSKGQDANGGLADACLALWRDAIDQAERITKRRDSQQIQYAITAARDLAVLIGEDFEAIAKTKREEIDGKAKSKPSAKPAEKKPKKNTKS